MSHLEQVGSHGAFGTVASRKSQVARSVAFGDVIGYWLLVIGGRAEALHCAGLKSHLQKIALQSNAPKPFTIHHSPFTLSWDGNPTLRNWLLVPNLRFLIHHSSFIIRKPSFRFRFLIPHSSFLIQKLFIHKKRSFS